MATESEYKPILPFDRRGLLALGAGAAITGISSVGTARGNETGTVRIVTPPENKRILLSCKLGMLPKKLSGKKLTTVQRLRMADEAGFDGVDFDQAGEHTPEETRRAVQESRVFVHNAINHAHWSKRLTSAKEAERAQILNTASGSHTQPAAAAS
jgi:L-ribulose-5-phosphate 3-epimerase